MERRYPTILPLAAAFARHVVRNLSLAGWRKLQQEATEETERFNRFPPFSLLPPVQSEAVPDRNTSFLQQDVLRIGQGIEIRASGQFHYQRPISVQEQLSPRDHLI